MLIRAALLVLLPAAMMACNGARSAASDDPSTVGTETVYVLRDNGMRCIAAPCFSTDVTPVAAAGAADVQPETVSGVDLSALNVSPATRDSLMARIATADGLTAAGRIEAESSAGPAGRGRVFRVTRVAS